MKIIKTIALLTAVFVFSMPTGYAAKKNASYNNGYTAGYTDGYIEGV